MDIKFTVQEVAYHRNGISGIGFYAVRFRYQPEGSVQEEKFLAILFDTPGECAVVGIDRLDEMGVKFAGGNSWRGDRFEQQLRDAVENYGSVGRVGPFCIPQE